MNIQIFGTKKCKDTQKALRFFKERNIKIHFVNLKEKEISKGELNNIKQSIAIEELIDKESKEYQKLNLKYIIHNIEEKLLEHPLLFKTPIVRFNNKSTVGINQEAWKEWIKTIKG